MSVSREVVSIAIGVIGEALGQEVVDSEEEEMTEETTDSWIETVEVHLDSKIEKEEGKFNFCP